MFGGFSRGRPVRVLMRMVVVASVAMLWSCTSNARVTDLPQRPHAAASPSAIPSASPTAGQVVLTPSSLAFITTGASAAQTVNVMQTNFDGAFSVSTAAPQSCSGIVTVSAASATSLLVTPVAAGQCVETITGGGGVSAPLTITVTTTSVGGT
jgi:hypothetical protein